MTPIIALPHRHHLFSLKSAGNLNCQFNNRYSVPKNRLSMTPSSRNITYSAKYLQITVLGAAALYFGKTLFIPLFMGLLIAMIMYPVARRFEKNGMTRTVSVTICITIVAVIFAALIGLLFWQMRTFIHDWPVVARKLEETFRQAQQWLAVNFQVTLEVQDGWLQNQAGNLGSFLGPVLRGTVNVTANTLFMLFMIPVFAALFLYHRQVFVRVLRQFVGPRYERRLEQIIQQVIGTYFRYIKGMIMVYIIVGILNSAGLMALGIPHAILFGMLTAVMTIIPYFGIVISALLPISAAWTAHESIWYPLGVIGVFSFVQYLEANVIFPKVVAAQLNVSTWATLVAILVGGIIWGMAGMVLFIPFVAILKIVADHMDDWKGLRLLLSRHPGV